MRRSFHYCLLFLFMTPGSAVVSADDELTGAQVNWFEKNIRPLLINKCYSCHSVEKGEAEGGLTLDSKEGWRKGGDHGPAIVPKDLDASLLIRAVRYMDPDLEMPPDKQLSGRELKLLEQWVQAGAPDPRLKTNAGTQLKNPADPVTGKSHWAFQDLSSPKMVSTKNLPRPESPIDYFVIQKLREKSLSLNRPADRRTLARRVYILLTGIPPTFEQVVEFEKDDSPTAYEQLVDRLLASPGFGERWARHWLDLARYADSNGLDENFLFREAWRYRNWTINAVNDDQPFDKFTTEQIAGDLLPFDSLEQRDRQRIGAGFLVVGPKVLLGVNGELQKMDVADELIDTVGKTFLGQTLGCARCHDHKFDPIPTQDYYALAGIFTSTEVMQRRYMLGQQRKMERLHGIGADENQKNEAYEKYWREQPKLKKRFDKTKKAVDLLKKKETKLTDVLKNYSDVLADEVKSEIKKSKDSKIVEFSKEYHELRHRLLKLQEQHGLELAKKLAPPPIPPRAMIPTDKSEPADESIRIAGQFDRKGKSVARGFLQVLGPHPITIAAKQSGRKELAAWLTDVDRGAGKLTARVLANRVWHHMLGRGIVRTTDNFGRKGEKPSHPELLDYLARRLIESDWSVKKLVREIALSQSFCQSSEHDRAGDSLDPDNQLLWRANRKRLSPEAYRDSVLFSCDELDSRSLDSSVNYLGDQATAVGANKNRRRTDFPNRSIYLPVIRNDLPEIFEAFDFADTHRTTGARPRTTVATTGLFILNDQLMSRTSKALAAKVLSMAGKSDEERIKILFQKILLAAPTEVEANQFEEYVNTITSLTLKELKSTASTKKPTPTDNTKKESEKRQTIRRDMRSKIEENRSPELEAKIRAWSTACHALFASSRFQILE